MSRRQDNRGHEEHSQPNNGTAGHRSGNLWRQMPQSNIWKAILPAIVYILFCQIFLTASESLLQSGIAYVTQNAATVIGIQNGGAGSAASMQGTLTDGMRQFLILARFDLQAAGTAVSALAAMYMTVRMLRVSPGLYRPLEPECRKGKRPSMLENGLMALCVLSGSVWLNALLQGCGAVAADAAASTAAGQTMQVSLPVGLIVYGVAAPYAEEVIFRGITFEKLWGSTNSWILGASGSSLLFGICHGNFVQGIYAWGMGMMLCCVLKRGESLKGVIFLHGAVNILTLVLSRANAYNGIAGRMALFTGLGIFGCSIIGLYYLWKLESNGSA